MDADSISLLPNQLITKVLVKLPIEDAIRTSVLSSKWEDKWTLMPDLVFKHYSKNDNGLTNFVDTVLLGRRAEIKAEIKKFQLDCNLRCNEAAINRWLPILCKKGIKDLRFHFGAELDSNMPSSIFSCHNLEHLEVANCFIKAPRSFKRHMLLRTLKLSHFHLDQITLENLVSNLPQLESLDLSQFAVTHLVIRSPSLRRFNIVGVFAAICLETPKLISARILLDRILDDPMNGGGSNILKFLGELPIIEELEILSMFSEYLASRGPIPKELPSTYDFLNKIVICMYGTRKVGVKLAFCLFRSAPNLKFLYIGVPKRNIWMKTTDVFFEQLEVVKILGFEDAASMLGFAKFILSCAPKLKKFVVNENDLDDLGDGKARVKNKLLKHPKLSSECVIFSNHSSSN